MINNKSDFESLITLAKDLNSRGELDNEKLVNLLNSVRNNAKLEVMKSLKEYALNTADTIIGNLNHY